MVERSVEAALVVSSTLTLGKVKLQAKLQAKFPSLNRDAGNGRQVMFRTW